MKTEPPSFSGQKSVVSEPMLSHMNFCRQHNGNPGAIAGVRLNLQFATKECQPFTHTVQSIALFRTPLRLYNLIGLKSHTFIFDNNFMPVILGTETEMCLFDIGMFDHIEEQLAYQLKDQHIDIFIGHGIAIILFNIEMDHQAVDPFHVRGQPLQGDINTFIM